ncbi:hypothetical protein EIP91_003305, partial [Steccherinum ochraceum]
KDPLPKVAGIRCRFSSVYDALNSRKSRQTPRILLYTGREETWKAMTDSQACELQCEAAGVPSLPRELVDHICTFMDRDVLATCSLLSSYWLFSARPQLFNSVTIIHKGVDEPCNTVAFLQLLDCPEYSSVSRHIRTLVIRGGGVGRPGQRGALSYKVGITATDIQHLLSRLPALHTLHLVYMTLDSTPAESFAVCPPRALKELKLISIGFQLPPLYKYWSPDGWASEQEILRDDISCSLVDFFNLFSRVEALYLRKVFTVWYASSGDNVDLFIPMMKAAARHLSADFGLGKVVFDRCSGLATDPIGGTCPQVCATVELLACLSAIDVLHTLDLKDSTPLTTKPLLVGSAQSLRSLHLTISPQFVMEETLGQYDVAKFRRLTELQITLSSVVRERYASPLHDDLTVPQWNAAFEIMRQCPATISSLTLEIGPGYDYHLPMATAGLDWGAVDTFFSREFTDLSRFLLVFRVSRSAEEMHGFEEAASRVRECLPLTHRRNLLEFQLRQ